jgi:ABC-type transporter lipoprotein component MlaA
MTGKKTHEQQLRIIEKREKTANADEALDAAADLHRNEQAREAYRKGGDLKVTRDTRSEDRNMVRDLNQESGHKKGSGHP